jgi:FtsP/CotA-like multicopper oxidase with cupredoxin domain
VRARSALLLPGLAATLLATACTGEPEPTPEPTVEPTPTPTPTPTPAPVVTSPAEATDLDDDPTVLHVALTAAAQDLEVGGQVRPVFAYNGQVPGPTLRAQLGDTLVVDLTNDLEFPTTIHWHGLDVPYDMDGVVWQRAPVAPGESFQYRFELNQAGTFWYHPHFDTERQVDLGLYGVVVVEDPADPAVDDLVLVFDDWAEYDADRPDDHHHRADPVTRRWLINGVQDGQVQPTAGEPLRLRVVNVSNHAYLELGVDGRRIGGDQGLLAAPEEPVTTLMVPGDRAEWELQVGPEAFAIDGFPATLHGGRAWGEPASVLDFVPTGDAAAPAPVAWPFAGGGPTADPPHTDITWVFQGDPSTGRWMISHEAFPDVTIPVIDPGQEVVIEVRNLSPTNHPFHLHGHAFEVLSIDGVPPAIPTFEDTVDVGVRQAVRLRVVGGAVGWWMAHCHILGHAEDGMMTILQVGDPE